MEKYCIRTKIFDEITCATQFYYHSCAKYSTASVTRVTVLLFLWGLRKLFRSADEVEDDTEIYKNADMDDTLWIY